VPSDVLGALSRRVWVPIRGCRSVCGARECR
jgi:hypothetical protein